MTREMMIQRMEEICMRTPLHRVRDEIKVLATEISVDQQKMIDNITEQINELTQSILKEHGL